MVNDALDFLVEMVESLIEDLGFDHIKISDSKTCHTTSYESVVVLINDKEYSISFNECNMKVIDKHLDD